MTYPAVMDRAGEGMENIRMLLGDAVGCYVEGRARRGEISRVTARAHRGRLNRFAETVGPQLDVADLDSAAVLAWQETVGARRPATRRAYTSSVRGFAAWAIDEGLLDTDPTRRLARVREPRRAPRALSDGQLARLELVLPNVRAVAIVALMSRLGLRCCEVARLDLADWDRDSGVILVRGKGDNERLLPVPADVDVILSRHVGPRSGGPVIGLTAHLISRMVGEWITAAGIKTAARDGVSAHALRHTAASNLLDSCHDVRTVQMFLGHTSLATTERYLRRPGLDAIRAGLGDSRHRTGT